MKPIKSWPTIKMNEVSRVASELKKILKAPCFIALEGDLGAGKTTLVNAFTSLLGEKTTSPTYSIVVEGQAFIHADFYRLENAEEIVYLELGQISSERDYFFAEWSMKYLDILSEELAYQQYYKLEIELVEDSSEDTRSYRLFLIENT
jgi:tRNA threonylcarbamoyladenosine biosynthesis protein TsaE